MSKRALITGITGQDGSYLAEFLLSMDIRYTDSSGVPVPCAMSVSGTSKTKSRWCRAT